MRSLLILLALAGVTFARPSWYKDMVNIARVSTPSTYTLTPSPVAYSNFAAAPAPIAYAAPVEISSQYHAQDELGQYSYGYAGGPSAKSEMKTWDGVTRGGYSYVDAEGKVQSVNYVSDPVNGFRVAATNLPVAPEPIPSAPLVGPAPVEDTPEVAAAKEAHFAAYAEAKAAADAAPDDPEPADEPAKEEPAPEKPSADVAIAPPDILPATTLSGNVGAIALGAYAPIYYPLSDRRNTFAPIPKWESVEPINHYAYSTYAPYWHPAPVVQAPYTYAAVAPVSYSQVAPAVAHAPIEYAAPIEISSQYHAQDELGQYSYGYAGGPSAKSEVRTWDGVTRGGYSYVDAEGKVQTVNYISDPVNGFRVAATNLPVAPAVPDAPVLKPVDDTPEVSAAKAEHLAVVEGAKGRLTAT